MRIRKLRLQSYRNHRDSTLDIGDSKFIIVRGANASGKSSIAQALSMNLTPSTMGLDPQGRGYAGKITRGESKAIITTEIQGQHTLENTVILSVSTSVGRDQKVKCLDTPDDNRIPTGFENFLARYKDALGIALNTDLFVSLGEKEQKALLAKLVLPSRYDFPKDTQQAVHEAIGANQIEFDEEPFAVIELAYKKLYKERETVNRQVKEFVIPDVLPIPKGVDSKSLERNLAEIKTERDKLLNDRDAAVAKANEVEVQRATLQTKIDGLRAELEKGKAKLLVLDTCIQSPENLAKLTATVGKEEELAKLRKQHNGIHGAMITVNEQIARLREVADRGATCPTCDQAIDSAKIMTLITELQKEYADSDAKIQALDTQIEAIGNIDAAKTNIKTHQQAIKDKEELTNALIAVVTTGKETKAKLEALPEKKDATLPFHNPLEVLQTKADNIIAQLRPVIAAEERAADIENKKKQLEKLEAKAKALHELVTYFGKDGIKAKLIAEYIGGFESKINSVLSAWGYKASLSNDLANFDVTTPRGYIGPVKEMSGAEAHMFKAAFQCAVSSAAGIGVVVVDEIEELGEDIRQPLYRTIYGLIHDGTLEQAILIGWSVDKATPSPKAPGSLYFYVEDGMVERLG